MNDPVNFVDPSGLKFEFADMASRNLFNHLRNNAALSVNSRMMLDRMESSSETITIKQACGPSPATGVFGRTTGLLNSKGSEVELWLGGNGNIAQSVLLHELIHANQILNGVDPGAALSEAAARDVGFSK